MLIKPIWSTVPLLAPKNLTMVELRDAKTALLAWEPVSNESIRGHFKGYKVILSITRSYSFEF